ncbi:MAG: tRNA (adenosine(37)-N6)-dimethylallyltransferase, partial [Acidimicrobiales bacterium]
MALGEDRQARGRQAAPGHRIGAAPRGRHAPPPAAVALVGSTAAGKSSLAVEIASLLGDVEVVSADSMCVYREMDVGTAKPGPAARAAVRHHLLDVADPSEDYSAARFQSDAAAALADVAGRGRRCLLVGGTGLYVRAVVDGLSLPGRWPEVAAALDDQACEPGGLAALWARLQRLDPLAASPIGRELSEEELLDVLGSIPACNLPTCICTCDGADTLDR